MKQIVTHLERRERSKRFPVINYIDVIGVDGQKYTIARIFGEMTNDRPDKFA